MSAEPHLQTPARPHGIDSVLGHFAMLLLTAVLFGGAFPEPGWWFLAWVALVPASLVAVRSPRRWRLAWVSFVVFYFWWVVRLSWMAPVTVGGYLALSGLMAAYWSLALLMLQVLHRQLGLPAILALPMAWVSMEFARGSFIEGGFNWFAIGHTQAPYLPGHTVGRIVQVADLFGEWTVSFVVCMTNGFIADALTRPWFRPITRGVAAGKGRRMRGSMRAIFILWSVSLSAAWWYGQFRIDETGQSTKPGVVVAVVQTNVPQDNKDNPTPEEEVRQWRDMLRLTVQAAELDPKPALIVWPETMVPSPLNREAIEYFGPDGDPAYHHGQISALAQMLGTSLIVGSHWYHDFMELELPSGGVATVAKQRSNSAYLYDGQGRQADLRYDKVHIVPFGEYIPWVSANQTLKDLFIRYLSPYPFDYSLVRGERFEVFELRDESGQIVARFGTPICFEDALPYVCRNMVYGSPNRQKRADLLVNLTNDGWFSGTAQPLQHIQIATLRAIENRVPIARSVNTGVSGFIDSAGRVTATVNVSGSVTDVAGVASQAMRFDERVTLFALVGRAPVAGLLVVTLVLVVVGLVRRGKMAPSS